MSDADAEEAAGLEILARGGMALRLIAEAVMWYVEGEYERAKHTAEVARRFNLLNALLPAGSL